MARRRDRGTLSLAARAWQLHAAAKAGDAAADRQLGRLAARGTRAGQAVIDVTCGWHRHPGQPDACDDEMCAEVLDGAVFAASWEAWWPPGGSPA